MCDSMFCKRNHHIIINDKETLDIVISKHQFKLILACLVEERNAVCMDCGKCHECKRILNLIYKFKKIEWKVRQIPNCYLKMLKFNKLKEKLELFNQKTCQNFDEALKDNVLDFF